MFSKIMHVVMGLAVLAVLVGVAGHQEAMAGKMYWTDAWTDEVQRANLDGTGVEDLVAGVSNPQDIALDRQPKLDHFRCYKVKGNSVKQTVVLKDQFGFEPKVRVYNPKFFCNPVDKNGEGISDPTAHLTCYRIKDKKKKRKVLMDKVLIENQFGSKQTLKVEKPMHLCVPSKKLKVILKQETINGDEKKESKE